MHVECLKPQAIESSSSIAEVVSCVGENNSGGIDSSRAGAAIDTPFIFTAANASIVTARGGPFTCALVGKEVLCSGQNSSGILGTSVADGATASNVKLLDSIGI